MLTLFTKHPRAVGESYWQHFAYASATGCKLMLSGLICMTHALCPFVFQFTGSQMAEKITDELRARRRQAQEELEHGK